MPRLQQSSAASHALAPFCLSLQDEAVPVLDVVESQENADAGKVASAKGKRPLKHEGLRQPLLGTALHLRAVSRGDDPLLVQERSPAVDPVLLAVPLQGDLPWVLVLVRCEAAQDPGEHRGGSAVLLAANCVEVINLEQCNYRKFVHLPQLVRFVLCGTGGGAVGAMPGPESLKTRQ